MNSRYWRTALTLILTCALLVNGPLRAVDCNANGVDDAGDIAAGTSPDCNANGVPDECDVAAGLAYPEEQELRTGGDRAERLALRDLDGDGHLDLVVADDFTVLSVFPGDGKGHLDGPVNFPTPGHSASAMVVEHLDGDTRLDVAVAYARTGRVTVFPGDGDGILAEAVSFEAPFPTSMTAGDLDGDGHIDLVTEGAVLFSKGDGTFGEPVTHGVHEGQLAAVDADGDGDLDLISNHSFLENKGNGTFKPPVLHGGDGANLHVLHLSQGEHLDIVQTTGDRIVLLAGRGDGTFAPPVPLVEKVSAAGLLVRHMNGDGLLDLVVTSDCCDDSSGTVSVYLARGPADFELAVRRPLAFQPASFAAGDLDGDGLSELLITEMSSDRVFLLAATFEPRSRDEDGDGVPDECRDAPFRRGDSNADGLRDLTDAIFILFHLFLCGAEPGCEKSADSDDSGVLDLSDAVHLLGHLFLGGPAPASPLEACGFDPTEDDLGCDDFPPCA